MSGKTKGVPRVWSDASFGKDDCLQALSMLNGKSGLCCNCWQCKMAFVGGEFAPIGHRL